MFGPMSRAPRSSDDARDAEELGDVLADDLRADEVAGQRLAELEQALAAAVLGLVLLEPAHLLAEARVLVGEPLVVGLHVDEVDVVPQRFETPARERSTPRTGSAREMRRTARSSAVQALADRFMFARRKKNGTARRTMHDRRRPGTA